MNRSAQGAGGWRAEGSLPCATMRLLDRVQLPADVAGHSIYRIDLAATALFVVAAAVATVARSRFDIAFAVLSCVLFGLGTVSFLWAYAQALGRSRHQTISVANIYGLSGSAPRSVQVRLHALTAVQIAVAITAASIHPFTAQAFGILVPMLGLGLGGLWAARHGDFGPRSHGRRSSRPQSKESGTHG